jgi:hypothetical protein
MNKNLRILVDADGCPVRQIVVDVAKLKQIPVVMICDLNHRIADGYSEVVIVDCNPDEADREIFRMVQKDDIVITGDQGLAATVLPAAVAVLDFSGNKYSKLTMDAMLLARHLAAKERRAGRHGKGPKKRTDRDNQKFRERLVETIEFSY